MTDCHRDRTKEGYLTTIVMDKLLLFHALMEKINDTVLNVKTHTHDIVHDNEK